MSSKNEEEEEEDYMSTEFLTKATGQRNIQEFLDSIHNPPTQPISKSQTIQWLELQIAKAKKEKDYKKKSSLKRELVAAQELESAKEGLSKNIMDDEENSKALQMMRKMGFEKGKGLGKDEKGIAEPISVALEKVIANEESKEAGGVKPKQTLGFKSKLPQKRKITEEVASREPVTASSFKDTVNSESEYVQRMKQRVEQQYKRRKGITSDDEDDNKQIDYDFL